MNRIGTPAKTGEILGKHKLRPRKSLGQNFLVEPKFIERIVQAAELDKASIVVEIGPGIGALTQALAQAAGYVVAVELDRSLIPVLHENLGLYQNVTIVNDDALKVDFDRLVQQVSDDHQLNPAYKVVANLPYYITTPVIMRLLEEDFNYSSLVLMVQKEVAQRITAVPGTKDYGALSIGVQYHCLPQIVTLVPKTVFIPKPEVESAVIKLTKRDVPLAVVKDKKLFFTLVKAAFGQRRKTLLNALGSSGLPLNKADWEKILQTCDINPQRRGETLSINEFAKLVNELLAAGY